MVTANDSDASNARRSNLTIETQDSDDLEVRLRQKDATIARLEQQLGVLQGRVEALSALEDVEGRLSEKEFALELRDMRIMELEEQISEFQGGGAAAGQGGTLHAQDDSRDKRIAELEEELRSVQGELESFAGLEDVQGRLDEKDFAIELRDMRIGELEQQLSAAESSLKSEAVIENMPPSEDLSRLMNLKDDATRALDDRIAELERHLQEAQNVEHPGTKEVLEEKDSMISERDSRITQLEHENRVLRSIDSLSESNGMESRVKEKEAVIEEQEERISELEHNLLLLQSDQDDAIAARDSQIAQLKQQLFSYQSSLQPPQIKAGDMGAQLREKNDIIEAQGARLMKLEEHARILESRNAELEQQGAHRTFADSVAIERRNLEQDRIMEATLREKDDAINVCNVRIAQLGEQNSTLEARLRDILADNTNVKVRDTRIAELEEDVCGLRERLDFRLRASAILQDRIGMLSEDCQQQALKKVSASSSRVVCQSKAHAQRAFIVGQIEVLAESFLGTSMLLRWARVARDSRLRREAAVQESDAWARQQALEQARWAKQGEIDTSQVQLEVARSQSARLAAVLHQQATRRLGQALRASKPELKSRALTSWLCAMPVFRLEREMEAVKLICDRKIEVHVRKCSDQATQFKTVEDEKKRMAEKMDELERAKEAVLQEKRSAVNAARKDAERRMMVRMNDAIGTMQQRVASALASEGAPTTKLHGAAPPESHRSSVPATAEGSSVASSPKGKPRAISGTLHHPDVGVPSLRLNQMDALPLIKGPNKAGLHRDRLPQLHLSHGRSSHGASLARRGGRKRSARRWG